MPASEFGSGISTSAVGDAEGGLRVLDPVSSTYLPRTSDHTSSLSRRNFSAVAVAVLSVKGSTGVEPEKQARSSRAKTKAGEDTGRSNGSAIRVTEDAASRRFAAASAETVSRIRRREIPAPFPPAMTASGIGFLRPRYSNATNFNHRQRSPQLAA